MAPSRIMSWMRIPLKVYLWPSDHIGPEIVDPGSEMRMETKKMSSDVMIFFVFMYVFTKGIAD